jgi:hypothetical protein
MDLVMQAFPEQSLAWLFLNTIVAIIASYLIYKFIKKQEIIDTVKEQVKADIYKSNLEIEKSKTDRIRSENLKWANPILGSVKDLEFRLGNILEKQGYLALSTNYQTLVNPNWSVTYDYFINSTLYLFGQYFAWMRMLQDDISFEIFQSPAEKETFFQAIDNVGHALRSFPPHYSCTGKDMQVFALQQRAIGELLIISDNNSKRCMTYPEFLIKLKKDTEFRTHLKPLKSLIENVNPSEDCRWQRLTLTRNCLTELMKECEKLLAVIKKTGERPT